MSGRNVTACAHRASRWRLPSRCPATTGRRRRAVRRQAPAAVASQPCGVPFAGGSLPLGMLLALVARLIVASSIGRFAKHLPSAGGSWRGVLGRDTADQHRYVSLRPAWVNGQPGALVADVDDG